MRRSCQQVVHIQPLCPLDTAASRDRVGALTMLVTYVVLLFGITTG